MSQEERPEESPKQGSAYRIVGCRPLYRTPWLSLVEREYLTPQGELRRWVSADRPRPGVVLIVPLTEQGEVILVGQFRPPQGRVVWELPAGLMDVEGENAITCARRELLEETGYEAGTIQLLAEGAVSSGLSNEYAHVFLAQDCRRVSEERGVGGEEIELRLIPLSRTEEEVGKMLMAGEVVDVKLLGLLKLAEEKLKT